MSKLSKKQREEVWNKSKGRCWYCGNVQEEKEFYHENILESCHLVGELKN